jgi:predicted HTH transcriptional regulator
VISALANISEGYRTMYGEPLTVSNIGQLDIIQAIVGLSATGLISLIVFALSEIIGVDVETTERVAQRAKPKTEPRPVEPVKVSNTVESNADSVLVEQAREVKQQNDDERIVERREHMAAYLDENPDTGPTKLAQVFDISRSTVYSDLKALNGRVKA